jgi:RimJ/RimL family protein N-acetyltransferase
VILSSTELTDGELLLRPLQRTDREALFEAVTESVAQISPWLPWCHTGYAIAETDAFIESCITAWAQQTHFPFAIFDARTGQYFGGTGVNHIERMNRLGNVGYWIRTSATRRGMASKAVRLVARFAFETVQLVRLEIVVRPENSGSRRVAEKAGAKFETMARNRIFQHGKTYDAALYSLIPGDLLEPGTGGPQSPGG